MADDDLTRITDVFDLGLILCDGQAGILSTNAHAESLLGVNGLLRSHDNRLGATHAADHARLRHAISTVAREGRALALSITAAEDDEPLTLGFYQTAEPDRVFVTIARPRRALSIPLSRLQGAFGLTEAEARVLRGLIDGKSLDAIANEHGRSVNTVRTQLKRIFVKMGTNRQSDLVRIAMAAFMTGPSQPNGQD